MLALFVAVAAAGPCRDQTRVDAHTVRVDLLARSITETWSLVLDPALCPDGPELPRSLSGAAPLGSPDAEGRVQVARARTIDGPTSASLTPWGAAARATRVWFVAPASATLQVFADDLAHSYAKGDQLEYWWPPTATGEPTLVWSTWDDWAAAGEGLAKPVRAGLPRQRDIGVLGRSLRSAPLESLVSRIDAELAVAPDEGPGWTTPRPWEDILRDGRGTPTERGMILLTMLRDAGYDARPAWFTPEDDPRTPRTLPAPHLLVHPAIAVRLRNRETIYIDPGTRGARPPEVPARIRGGRFLGAGDHLVVPRDSAAPRGEVRIQAESALDTTGRIRTVARVTPVGAAEQALRGALDGRTAEEWPEIVGAWMTPRGEIRDLVVSVEGLDGMQPFGIELRFTDPERLAGSGSALKGPIRDLIAPGLAAVLPPDIAIAERITLKPDPSLMALTAVRPLVPRGDGLLVNRSMFDTGESLVLSSDWRVLALEDAGEAIEAASQPSEVLVFPIGDRQGRKAAQRLPLPAEEIRVIEAMLLWRLGQDKKAERQLAKLQATLKVEQIAALLARYVPPGDPRPWEALADFLRADAERIAVIDGLVAIGDQRLGWQFATRLTQSDDPLTRARAFVQVARLQGPLPNASADPSGAQAWREPVKLLQLAMRRSPEHAAVVRPDLAWALLREGRVADAGDALESALEDPTPWVQAVYAEFGASSGAYGIDVLGLVQRALAEAPDDPGVREACGRALARLGRRREGVAEVLRAAELVGNDVSRWLSAADMAADNGDLRAAVYAARRASDLAPGKVQAAVPLQRFATLAGDQEQVELARQRSGEDLFGDAGTSLESLIAFAPEYELALLRHHVAEVEGNRALLRRRAELHAARQMVEEAALDGSLLLTLHRDNLGAHYMAAGSTGRIRHSNPTRLLARAGNDATAREAKMDMQLAIGEDPSPHGERGKVLSLLKSRPEQVASMAATWPLGIKDFTHAAPEGFKDHKLLSAVRGVLAWSDRDRQMVVMRTERSTGDFPPPLQVIFKTGPTVLTTGRGAAVVRLDGGVLPIYAGITIHEGQDVIGIGLSPAAARDAVLYGIGDLAPPPP